MNDQPPYDDPAERRPRYGQADGGRPPQPTTNGYATTGLVLGILSLCGGILSLPAMIVSIIGMTRASSRGGAGRGMAIAGLVLSIFGFFTVIPLMMALLLPAVARVRDAAATAKSINNLKQIAIASHVHQDSLNYFPSPSVEGQTGPLEDRLGWRVSILPYIEQGSLFSVMNLKEGWKHPSNANFVSMPLSVYLHPNDERDNQTRYRVFYGGGAALNVDKKLNMQTIPDGNSNTIYVVEAGDRVPWAQCKELPFDKNAPLPALGHPGGDRFNVLMFDGSVRVVKKSVSPDILKAGIHASDGTGFDP